MVGRNPPQAPGGLVLLEEMLAWGRITSLVSCGNLVSKTAWDSTWPQFVVLETVCGEFLPR